MKKSSIEKGVIPRTPAEVQTKKWPEMSSGGPRFLSNAYGKVQSRYLGLSAGSCHDLCKYGRKHEVEDDRKPAIFRWFMANGSNSDAVQNHARSLNRGDRMKSSGLKLKASHKSKVLQLDKIVVNGNNSTVEFRTPPLEKNSIEIPGQTILQDSTMDKVSIIKVFNSRKKKNQVMKLKDPPVSGPSPVQKTILKQKDTPASAKMTSGGGANIFKKKIASYMNETITSSALKLNNQTKHIASPRSQSVKRSMSVGHARSEIYSKMRCPMNFDRNLNRPRNLDKKDSRSFKMLDVGDSNLLNLQKSSVYSTPSHNSVNLKARKFRNFKLAARENIVDCNDYVGAHEIIQVKSEDKDMDANNASLSIEDDGYTSEFFSSDVTDNEIEDMKLKHNHKGLEEEEAMRIRTQALLLDDASSLPYKMKFKRGKVIELPPTETVGPRRLRFRKGKAIYENSNGEGMKRTVKRRGIGDMKAPGAEARGNSSEVSAVMLKHQDSHQKKDMQALFNHVIEETASKLVKARKSKVKALVGAFETVILLQETKAAHVV